MMGLIQRIKKIQSNVERGGGLFFSRKRAHAIRKEVVRQKGREVVDSKTKKFIKSYAKKTFGSSSYWPWLALYTEIRGEFKSGWIPDDYYTVVLLNKFNPESAKISNYKTFDYRIFPEFSIRPLVVKISGNLYDSAMKRLNRLEATAILSDYNGEVVVKEDEGLGGAKVKFIHSNDLDLDQLPLGQNYIIQPALQQHENLNRLNKNSVNTVRVFTYLNSNGDIAVKFAYFRFGIGDSRVDNSSSGGGMCNIKSSGFLEEVTYDKTGIAIGDQHPETGIKLNSVKIPNFNELLKQCMRSHEKFSYMRFLGWDVAVNSEGKPVLLEWNSSANLWKAEALFGPFWTEELKNGEI
jgi:hypothetical protein